VAQVIYTSLTNEVGKITLNDPDHLNAMSEGMAKEFRTLVSSLPKEAPGLRAIILSGAGRAFSAGGDLDMLEKKRKLSGEENRLRMLDFYHSFLGILSLKIPLIAAINGHAVGAGLCLASACDMRIASKKAKLGLTFTKLGLHPGMGASYFIPRIIGQSSAYELLLTGRVIEAEEALRLGLVNRVEEPEKVEEAAVTLAEEVASSGPESVRQLLETLRGRQEDLERVLEREALCQAVNYASKEFAEGVKAAREKRQPQF